jgi:phage shock protein A
MDDLLLTRLEAAVERLLEKNRQLEAECTALRQQRETWCQQRSRLREEVDQMLARLEQLPQGDR